jgi:putative ABC transport system permease protein
VWLDYSGTALYPAFAAVDALSTLMTVIIGRRRDLTVIQFAGAMGTGSSASWQVRPSS